LIYFFGHILSGMAGAVTYAIFSNWWVWWRWWPNREIRHTPDFDNPKFPPRH
jgi:hypothetical protein